MLDLFWAKVDQSAGPVGCWPWTGSDNGPAGYGLFWHISTGKQYAHRFAYELVKGPIPEGLTIDHLCRNRGCVNPAHLEAVTMKENSLRGNSRNAINARKTHCVRGHNDWGRRRDNGHRVCLTCEPNRAPVPAIRPDKRQWCWCGHRYKEHATEGTCLAVVLDPCQCHEWAPRGTPRSEPDRSTLPQGRAEEDSGPTPNEAPGHPADGPRRPAPTGVTPPAPVGAPDLGLVP